MSRDFQKRFPFFSCFSDSTNELVMPDALVVVRLTTAIEGGQTTIYHFSNKQLHPFL